MDMHLINIVNKADRSESAAAESRSTSAGSGKSGEMQRPAFAYAVSGKLVGDMPTYEYPVPVVVRNTFIDAKVGRPESLDEFFKERRIHSCPAPPPCDDDSESVPSSPEPSFLHDAFSAGAQAFMDKMIASTGFWTQRQGSPIMPAMEPASANLAPRVLVLSEVLPGSASHLGSQELSTLGSAGHFSGHCKPCAFFYTKGCESGTQCLFCHLCPPDEKRRRQKDKHAAFREMRRQRRQVRL
jgi:hypothetical protein